MWIFWGLAGWKLRLRSLRFFYVQLKVSQTNQLIYVVLWAPRHDIAARCPIVYTAPGSPRPSPIQLWTGRILNATFLITNICKNVASNLTDSESLSSQAIYKTWSMTWCQSLSMAMLQGRIQNQEKGVRWKSRWPSAKNDKCVLCVEQRVLNIVM